MRSIRTFTIVVVAAAALVSAGMIAHAQTKPPAAGKDKKPEKKADTFKPMQSVHQMMEGQNKLFREIKEGLLDKDWRNATDSAWILAEVSNVNQYHSKNPKYKGFAKKLADDCAKLAKALKKRDEKASKQMISQVGQTCSACHDQFK